MTYRILVTGSRSWTDRTRIAQSIMTAINESQPMLVDEKGNPDRRAIANVVVMHGACPTGADALAQDVCDHMGIDTDPYPADWEQYKKRAGFIRNIMMVQTEPDICLAFLRPCLNPKCHIIEPHGTHGTSHCMKQAELAGVPVRQWGWREPDEP